MKNPVSQDAICSPPLTKSTVQTSWFDCFLVNSRRFITWLSLRSWTHTLLLSAPKFWVQRISLKFKLLSATAFTDRNGLKVPGDVKFKNTNNKEAHVTVSVHFGHQKILISFKFDILSRLLLKWYIVGEMMVVQNIKAARKDNATLS